MTRAWTAAAGFPARAPETRRTSAYFRYCVGFASNLVLQPLEQK
jgi:hypothetical protein